MPGATVTCIDASNPAPPKVTSGRQYEILAVNGSDVQLADDSGSVTWLGARRFEKV